MELGAGNWDDNSVWPEPTVGRGGRRMGREVGPCHEGLEGQATAFWGHKEPWQPFSEADLLE